MTSRGGEVAANDREGRILMTIGPGPFSYSGSILKGLVPAKAKVTHLVHAHRLNPHNRYDFPVFGKLSFRSPVEMNLHEEIGRFP